MKSMNIAWSAFAVCLLASAAGANELLPNGGFEELRSSDFMAGLEPKIPGILRRCGEVTVPGLGVWGTLGRRRLLGRRLRRRTLGQKLLPNHLP